MRQSSRSILWLSMMFLQTLLISQDPGRFDEAVDQFGVDDQQLDYSELIVFTGSSSVRFWPNLGEVFSSHNVINRGFGGSMMSDLLHFIEELIIQYQPNKVFIYEGDNDLAAGKSVGEIVKEAQEIVRIIRQKSPGTMVYFISAKPSLARWHLKDAYQQFNYRLGLWAMIQTDVTFIDVWTPMCGDDGNVLQDLFIEDGLHMNSQGYSIWNDVIGPYVTD